MPDLGFTRDRVRSIPSCEGEEKGPVPAEAGNNGVPGAAKNTGDDAWLFDNCIDESARAPKLGVMPGLDPGIHDDAPQLNALRKSAVAARPHGLPGQARQ